MRVENFVVRILYDKQILAHSCGVDHLRAEAFSLPENTSGIGLLFMQNCVTF